MLILKFTESNCVINEGKQFCEEIFGEHVILYEKVGGSISILDVHIAS